MKRSTRTLLFLAGAGVGGLVGAYLVLRRNRERIRGAARTTREVADRADRIARLLEHLSNALEPRRKLREESREERRQGEPPG